MQVIGQPGSHLAGLNKIKCSQKVETFNRHVLWERFPYRKRVTNISRCAPLALIEDTDDLYASVCANFPHLSGIEGPTTHLYYSKGQKNLDTVKR